VLHLVHPRIGPAGRDDRVVYQRSRDGGARWSAERVIFAAGSRHRRVVPNLALAARGSLVAVAWRTRGPRGTTLFVRVSRDGGTTFGPRRTIASSERAGGLGVPALAVGRDVIAVAWTRRASGDIRVSRSIDGGQTFSGRRPIARTTLSIDCGRTVLDGLVGLAAAGDRMVLAWASAGPGGCLATRLRSRASSDGGERWGRPREITRRGSYGWPELAASRGTVLATVQLTDGRLLLARSGDGARSWSRTAFAAPKGRSMGAGDVSIARGGVAWLAWVEEAYDGGTLRRTRVMARRSADRGRTWKSPETVSRDAPRLRQAANVAIARGTPAVVYQAGALDGSPRDLLVSRRGSAVPSAREHSRPGISTRAGT
jgi:hypothetical protein